VSLAVVDMQIATEIRGDLHDNFMQSIHVNINSRTKLLVTRKRGALDDIRMPTYTANYALYFKYNILPYYCSASSVTLNVYFFDYVLGNARYISVKVFCIVVVYTIC
jgi:hypothetical protein